MSKLSGPFNRGYFHSIYFADPDGQILEIATQGPGYALDESIAAGDDPEGSAVARQPG